VLCNRLPRAWESLSLTTLT